MSKKEEKGVEFTREELVDALAKSMYKNVKKALSAQGKEYARKAHGNEGKDVVEDILDDNYVAEAKEKVPPKKSAQMYKSKEKGIDKLKKFKAKMKKNRCWDGYEPTPGKKPYSEGSCRPKK